MDAQDFRAFGKAAIDLVASYTENLRERNVLPDVEPGYLQNMIPSEVPREGENWRNILEDFERVILPGVTHWQSPQFHAYYPSSTSYPSIVGELLSAGISVVGFSWISSPACTELEVVVMDWLGKLLGLPEQFLNCSEGNGGGVIQGSASEATYLCLLAAKERMFRRVQEEHPSWEEGTIKSKMVAYTSDQSNSSVEKAGLLASMKMRLLASDEDGTLSGITVRRAIEDDVRQGLIPTYVCATLGTTATCAYDDIAEIGAVCREFGIWLHVDAAYAGSACVCPEYRYLLNGVQYADSFNFNPHKWLLVNFDCSALWVQNSDWLIDAFNVDRIYLQHHKQGSAVAPDYRHWQIPLGRRFRALKLWITLRCYGVNGLQEHIRNHVDLAKLFESFVEDDKRFEIISKTTMGLVCFRLKGSCEKTKELLNIITSRKKLYMIAGKFKDQLCIRFVVCSRNCKPDDIKFAWNEIQSQADILLSEKKEIVLKHAKVVDNENSKESKIIHKLMN